MLVGRAGRLTLVLERKMANSRFRRSETSGAAPMTIPFSIKTPVDQEQAKERKSASSHSLADVAR